MRFFLLSAVLFLILVLVGCNGDNSITPTPTTNPFAGNWNITFDDSSGDRVGSGTITIGSGTRFEGNIVFMRNRVTVTGTVNYHSGEIRGGRLENGGFHGYLSGNSGSGDWCANMALCGTWSASRR